MTPPDNPKELAALPSASSFARRHIGPSDSDIESMLDSLGFDSLDALSAGAIPEAIQSKQPLDLGTELPPQGLSEAATLRRLESMAAKNKPLRSWIGMGYHACLTPAVIQRNVLESPGWYTAYTPYQAEIAQGRLEALLNFQTLVLDLTALAVANASLLDEATAGAEAMALAFQHSKRKRTRFFVASACHPQTLEVLETRAWPLGIEIVGGDPASFSPDDGFFGALLQYPATDGALTDPRPLIERLHEVGALAIMACDPLALTMLTPPGELGADIAVGSTQRFGMGMGWGGPHAAFLAARDAFKRQIPGRIVGVSRDREGRPALRLALQTREQHIRREKATSNICTAQVLPAVVASLYAVYHGPEGLRAIGQRVHSLTATLATSLETLGHRLRHSRFFDTVRVDLGEPAHEANVLLQASEAGMNLRSYGDGSVGISLDETSTEDDVEDLLQVFRQTAPLDSETTPSTQPRQRIPDTLRRQSAYLEHPVFHRYRSETEMLRYLHRLESRDLSLNTSMIPLGSCTMKLNATTEMLPITWKSFAGIHPFAPADQTEGYAELCQELEEMLAEITGFAAVSLQPNAGSQGEYAGLLTIRQFQRHRGEGSRNLCLIPTSAHGTNPASAVMAGLEVVAVACDREGNIDLDDLERKASEAADRLSALMVTYPSTHGVFEETILAVCDIVHRYGGQVYLDGANMNAMVGLCKPAELGADVCHLNLHKTFCIPHGGGGPGMGPIAAKPHLAPYLPGHGVGGIGGDRSLGAVGAAPFGSGSILPISWAYITMMGSDGLRRASQVAILNANYMAKRLTDTYPVLYKGAAGLVAHECILDLRPLRPLRIEVDDVAKRLIDYGFHAPTVSWPVPGTIMIEPTESESRAELDRYCDALISIRREAEELERTGLPVEESVLRGAPHTAEAIATDDWSRPYTRRQAAYPAPWLREHKYWPPVGRIDNVQGDRHLVCTCAGMDEYLEP